ncbi:2,3-diaminopropionate biosynthesis protein SbnB [Streptomyces avermitilis]|uniref:Ornithine cyclodeaminase n=2 Tax=Streptomyces avermitilis TaxID=33903 RepID=Q79Z74_STRAW|nr:MULTISPECIES: 2,3-diaminopropionate biosynthesis protein SbnB [Streptomyces]KUN56796.1 2,3-diaminopropionate biosynthesis protein SbnB [Streptomyces avermitilis]MYS99236.1 2,3-diaminopropionate biosynthesis protein SbnB [Streptomyces sp. SID5469]OOV32475.1 2,3-diaminopropionate biosynthesis protein SbnB [Streptomyces avermitilis]BAB69330.1 ornithine cyclodeaminase [Streptomyces avermitilis]BAC71357.1 putative ornithine cyclodeaminase [Streptomyces avermitilis MA-4680 = NBRC 14893]
MLILRRADVTDVLSGRETEIIDLVAETYRLHDEGQTSLPHSTFLRFPEEHHSRDRIIGLPAYRGGERPVAGMKWISSFPGNVAAGTDRASAAVVLNSLGNGHPVAFVEGAVISAKRTAASAALAARELTADNPPAAALLIGCGVINLEILRFLAAALPDLREAALYDTDPARAEAFAARCAEEVPGVKARPVTDLAAALGEHRLVSLATTAATPHMDLSACGPDTTVLHISLRDLTAEAVLGAVNVVDDADHVCRERTSLDLAQQATGNRDFVAAPIGALLRGTATLRRTADRPVVYSPFGLGVLDLALAEFVREEADRRGLGVRVEDFLPAFA